MVERNVDTRSVIELLSAGAVLIGLIFVGFELRQNTAAVEATTLQSSTDGSVAWMMDIATDPEMTRVWMTPVDKLGSLTEVERMQLHLVLRAQWFRFQNAYLQHLRGTLNEDDWEIYKGYICRTQTTVAPNDRAANLRVATWGDHRNVLLAEFVQFVENCRITDGRETQ